MHDQNGSVILQPGRTCWRIERAERFALIVDAAEYFAAFRSAMQQARHCVMMIGWEFDTRISLDPRDDSGKVPDRLGRFLSWVVRQNPDLKILMLEWDIGMIRTLGRGSTPLRIADWVAGSRISLKLDGAHPAGAAHHQKIVVIDEVLAFCGGIDMTADRWDTRAHPDRSDLRRRPTTRRHFGPWHDAMVAVDGDAARALGQLARERWTRATNSEIAPPPAVPPAWPKSLPTSLENVDVAISRTAPEFDGRDAVHEIEALYLDIIAATRRSLYIESQYFASRKLAEAMVDRLREADGPEIVVINPETADGWLQEEVMGSSRARLLGMIRQEDRHGRFRIYTPVAEEGTPIYVHAKIVVMDDRLLRIGSSNLNNRSLGFDTECDLSVEARPDDPDDAKLRRQIAALRNDLLSEHLGVTVEEFETALAREDHSLIGAIETLRGTGRTLVPFTPPELNRIEDAVLGESDLLDPERPARRWRSLRPRRLLSRVLASS